MQALSQLSYGPGTRVVAARPSLGGRPGQIKRKMPGRRGGSALLLVGRDVGDFLEIDVVLLVLEDLVVEVVVGLDRLVGVDLRQILDIDRLGLDLLRPQRLGLDRGQALER